MLRMIFVALVCLFGSLGNVTVNAEAPLAIQWNELAPPRVEDPFRRLSQQQLQDLALAARVRNLIAAGKVATNGETAREAAVIEQRLTQEGIDVAYLLSVRDQVRRLRERQQTAVQAELDGTVVRLAGFAVPLTSSGNRVTQFLLVPSADSCSDAQLPAANQAIFVRTADGIPSSTSQIAVRVTGRIEAKQSTCFIPRKLGIAKLKAAYAIAPQQIEVYSSDQGGARRGRKARNSRAIKTNTR